MLTNWAASILAVRIGAQFMLSTLVQATSLSPRHLYLVAALAIAGGLVLDYVEAQRIADRALALRKGPPPVALIQEFEDAVHQGLAREVRLRAETRLGEPIIVTLGPEDAPQTAVVLPLFPVSEIGISALGARARFGDKLQAVRPLPRPEDSAPRPNVVGYLLHWTDSASFDPADMISARLGSGSVGSIVEINGERISGGDIELVLHGAMAARGAPVQDKLIAVSPYVNGRDKALAPPPSSGLQKGLFWGGVSLGLGGLLASVARANDSSRRTGHRRRPGEGDDSANPSETQEARVRFQTILSQDQINASNDPAVEKSASRAGIGVLPGLRNCLDSLRIRR